MVKRVDGLDRGPPVPRVFGGDVLDSRVSIAAGDEVRCARGRQEIYIGVFGVSADGWLLGHVVNFGLWTDGTPFRLQVGELVQIRTDRILAVLPSPTSFPSELVEAPEALLSAAHR